MVPATTHLIGFSGETIWPLGHIALLVKIGDEVHSASAWMNFMVIRRIHGNITVEVVRVIPMECAMISGPSIQPPAVNQVLEEKINIAIHPEYLEQTVAIGSTLTEKGARTMFFPPLLKQNWIFFAWQKKRGQAPERNKVIQEEVEKHFKDLNNACPKDCYPLPEIDWKVESLCGYSFKCFLDAYKGYHQIKMAKEDEEKTAFITSQGIFCYSKMPFGLKNAGSTYQRLVDKAFQKQIGRNLEPHLRGSESQLYPMEIVGVSLAASASKSIEKILTSTHSVVCNNKSPMKATVDVKFRNIQRMLKWMFELEDGSEAGLILTNPEGAEFTYVMRFRFDATNNEAKYEALIAGLRIAEKMGIKNLQANVDSKLVANQVNGSYIAKESGMVLLKELKEKSIEEKEILVIVEEEGNTWMTPICEYLTKEILPEDKKKARAVRRKAAKYAMINGTLYKKSFLGPWLRIGIEKKFRMSYGPTVINDSKSSNGESHSSLTLRHGAFIPAKIGHTNTSHAEIRSSLKTNRSSGNQRWTSLEEKNRSKTANTEA
ncbi:reverse transcriptase domain-containing protein [Tanacetum coccineum]